MKRLLTAGIFGTILGIVGTGTANASIVSSGFLDEKLTEMTNATTLQLDTKANQSDLVNLLNIVGTPMEITYTDILRRSYYIEHIMGALYYETYADNTVPTNDISELIRLNYTDTDFLGLVGVVNALFEQREPGDTWPLRLKDIFDDYEYLFDEGYSSFMDLIIRGGTVSGRDGIVTVYGLKDLTTKIGTLPDGYDSVGAALTAIKGIAEDAKAAALAAIPDPKQEGSSGKFVLTVDIVGDNATYRWEKIDREGETTTTTE